MGKVKKILLASFYKERLNFVLAIRSNHWMWLPLGQRIRYNKWREFERVFTTGEKEKRYIREIIFGKKREIRYWQVTNNKGNCSITTGGDR